MDSFEDMSWDSLDEALMREVEGEQELEMRDDEVLPRPLARAEAVGDVARAVAEVEEAGAQEVPVAPVIRAPQGRFRLHAKKLYLTYAQCDTDPQEVLTAILTRWGEAGVKWAVVGQEQHQDGHNHLHVALWLTTALDTRDPHSLDALAGVHGNYQAMRDPVGCVKYCVKDGNFVSYGIDVQAYLRARAKKVATSFETVANMVIEGETLGDINSAHPGFMLQHLGKVKAYESFMSQRQSVDELVPWVISPEDQRLWHGGEVAVQTWLMQNLISGRTRAFCTPQLMIIGTTGVGKTSLMMALAKHCRVYYVPMGEDFYDGYSDEEFDLIVFDEYRAQKKIQWMNLFVQGNTVTLRVKGG